MTVGERIKERRKELLMSADVLAEKCNVSRSTIFRYESGDIEKLPASTLEPIANALHVSVSYLLGWEENNSNQAYSVKEIQLLNAIKSLSPESQDDVLKIISLVKGMNEAQRDLWVKMVSALLK